MMRAVLNVPWREIVLLACGVALGWAAQGCL